MRGRAAAATHAGSPPEGTNGYAGRGGPRPQGHRSVHSADRDRLLEARLRDGRPIDPQRTYRVVTSSFLALGGDGWGPALSRLHPDRVRVLSGSLPIRDALTSPLRERRFVLNSKDRPARTTPRVTAVGRDVRAPCP